MTQYQVVLNRITDFVNGEGPAQDLTLVQDAARMFASALMSVGGSSEAYGYSLPAAVCASEASAIYTALEDQEGMERASELLEETAEIASDDLLVEAEAFFNNGEYDRAEAALDLAEAIFPETDTEAIRDQITQARASSETGQSTTDAA